MSERGGQSIICAQGDRYVQAVGRGEDADRVHIAKRSHESSIMQIVSHPLLL